MRIPNNVPWINIAIGILAIISPFLLSPYSTTARWSVIIGGIVIAVIAIIELFATSRASRSTYLPVINILAGIWLFVSTGFAAGNMSMIWSNIVLGVAAIITALVALSYERVGSKSGHTSGGQPI